MRFSISLVILAALGISACSTADKANMDAALMDPVVYRERGFIQFGSMGGYESKLLATDRYQVDVRTNSVTAPERAVSIVLTRAAEMARENGFEYFQIESLNVKMNCVSGGMGGPLQSASPQADLTAKAGAPDDFKAGALVFDVAKIEVNLKPDVVTSASAKRIASQVGLANRNSCHARGAYRAPGAAKDMPWQNRDILYRAVETDTAI